MKDHYNLCWDCYKKDEDRYLDEWYRGESGHFIGHGTCDVCGRPAHREKESLFGKIKSWFD